MPNAEEANGVEVVEGEEERGSKQETTKRRRIGDGEEQQERENKTHIPDTLEQQLGKFIGEKDGGKSPPNTLAKEKGKKRK